MLVFIYGYDLANYDLPSYDLNSFSLWYIIRKICLVFSHTENFSKVLASLIDFTFGLPRFTA